VTLAPTSMPVPVYLSVLALIYCASITTLVLVVAPYARGTTDLTLVDQAFR